MESEHRADNGDTETSRMDGFGSETVMSPFHYGSVADGMSRGSSLEQRLKKKYWKTKQTVIQKLGKSQDEFVIAGDADIDSKLEKAYHLKSSCQDLLSVLERYAMRTRVLSSDEFAMGEYLVCVSESEYTNAGEVMCKVGKVEQKDSLARMDTLSPIVRMQQEFATFKASAISDLDYSIRTLEKARTEYRAALLWMKKVSEKLQDPDYRDQLAKFREAQAAVKETKYRFEKLKADLSEKIDMVSASRCNLLSRSLPAYQKHVLNYMDVSAAEFHRVLADVRATHHHQYRVTKIMEEIRELELEEGEGPESAEHQPTGSGGGKEEEEEEEEEEEGKDDVTLIDVGRATMPGDGEGEGVNAETVDVDVNDMELVGLGADLEQLLDQPPSASDQLNDLLGLDLQGDEATKPTSTAARESSKTPDQLFDDWNNFSAFMCTEKADSSGTQNTDWQKELMGGSLLETEGTDGGVPAVSPEGPAPSLLEDPPSHAGEGNLLELTSLPIGDVKERSPTTARPSEPLGHGIDELLGMKSGPPPPPPSDAGMSLADDILALSLGDPTPSMGKDGGSGVRVEPTITGTGLETLDPTLFQQPSILPTLPSLQPSTTLPSTLAHPSPSPLAPGTTPYAPFRPPMTVSQGPIIPPQAISGPRSAIGVPTTGIPSGPQLRSSAVGAIGGQGVGRGRRKEEEKGTSWMNVFAHLDPLANEKV